VYGRNASKLINALQVEFPQFEFEILKTKPRRNSFEITFFNNNKEIQIWSGLNLQPRKLKFPELDHIIQLINNQL